MRRSVEPAVVRALRGLACTLAVGLTAFVAAMPAAWAGGGRSVPELRRDVEQRLGLPHARALAKVRIAVHMTTRDGKPVSDFAAFERAYLRANELLEPHGIEVEVASIDMVAIEGRVHNLGDRRKLARYAPAGRTIHVFIVESLEPEHAVRLRNRVRGLYWRSAGLGWIRGRHWISVSNDAPTTTLAHEIGHLLGLRHEVSARNVMCSCREGANIRFSPTQGIQMRSNARTLARDEIAARNWGMYRRRAHRVGP